MCCGYSKKLFRIRDNSRIIPNLSASPFSNSGVVSTLPDIIIRFVLGHAIFRVDLYHQQLLGAFKFDHRDIFQQSDLGYRFYFSVFVLLLVYSLKEYTIPIGCWFRVNQIDILPLSCLFTVLLSVVGFCFLYKITWLQSKNYG